MEEGSLYEMFSSSDKNKTGVISGSLHMVQSFWTAIIGTTMD